MKQYKFLIIFSFLAVFQSQAFSQQDSIPVTEIAEKNAKLNMDFPLEKVYIHFDKPYYAIGDTIWLKSYVVSVQNIPSPLSQVVYLDVVTETDSLVETLKLKAKNSVAPGSIVLSHQHYKQGNYRIRAYTRWMLNFDPAYFFSQNIPIGNAINKELTSHVSFSTKTTDKRFNIGASILFGDEENKPYRNKKVSWEVIADYDRVSRGKGVTNDKGLLTLDFSTSKDISLNQAELLTTLEVQKNEFLKASFPLNRTVTENDVQFFPEGGDLNAGLISQVAFKAIRSDGLGIEVSGKVVDPEGNVVAELSSQHLGMGKFSFTPENGKTYFANLQFADGSEGTFQLPSVKAEGMRLSVDNSDLENLKITISANPAFLKKNSNKGFYIIGRNGGVVYYAAQSVLRNPEYSALIPKSNFPSGIVQLSVLSSAGKVLSERVAFVRQADSLTLTLKSDLPSYQQRQKVNMKLQASFQDQPIKGNFSVSVIDESKVPFLEENESTIFSNLLLSSEIQGYIEKPNYYFHNTTVEKLEQLDLLMMTQGYRRYLYEEVLADKPAPIKFYPEQTLALSGIIRRSDGMPMANNKILLQIPEKAFYKDGVTDEKGRFSFTDLNFQDSVEVIINARGTSHDKNLMINIDGEPYPPLEKNRNAPDGLLNIDSALAIYLDNSKLRNSTGFLLKEVKVEGRAAKKPSHADHSSLSGLKMQADHVTQGSQLNACNNLLTCVSTVMGLTYMDYHLYLSRTYNSGDRRPIEIYVDDMPVDVSYLQSIEPGSVESIEVFLDDGLSGINQRSNTMGVVVVNLKEIKKETLSRQEFKDLFPPANIKKFNPKGYSVERFFYVPKYSGPRTSLQSKDNRSTIHWNPLLISDENGLAEFEYFTADDKGTYRVEIEGIGPEGHIGRAIYRFQVD